MALGSFALTATDANRWVLRLGSAWSMVDVSGEIMLAFDADGVIVHTGVDTSRLCRPSDAVPSIDGKNARWLRVYSARAAATS